MKMRLFLLLPVLALTVLAAARAGRAVNLPHPTGWTAAVLGQTAPKATDETESQEPPSDQQEPPSPSDQQEPPTPEAKPEEKPTEQPAESAAAVEPAADSNVHDLLASFTVFVLAIFVGFEVITKVPPTLHSPLMSGSNAISGITVVGALVIAGSETGGLSSICGLVAVILATVNCVGGFLITHQTLSTFRKRR